MINRYSLRESADLLNEMEALFELTVSNLIQRKPLTFKEELSIANLDPHQCKHQDWSGVSFDGEDLSGVDFSYSNLLDCSFEGVDFSNVNMFRANRDPKVIFDYLFFRRAELDGASEIDLERLAHSVVSASAESDANYSIVSQILELMKVYQDAERFELAAELSVHALVLAKGSIRQRVWREKGYALLGMSTKTGSEVLRAEARQAFENSTSIR